MPPASATYLPLRNYAIGGHSDTYATRLARLAVLMPLYGDSAMSRGVARDAACLNLVASWRARVTALDQAGLAWLAGPEAAVRRLAMLNCLPSSFIPEGRPGQPCGCVTFCPHCWGRQALASWEGVDAALFPTPPAPRRGPLAGLGDPAVAPRMRARRASAPATHSLVLRTFTFRFTPAMMARPGPHPLTRWLAAYLGGESECGEPPSASRRAATRRELVAAGSAGSLETVVVLTDAPGVEPGGMAVQVRQLHCVARPDYARFLDRAAAIANPAGGAWRTPPELTGVPEPTRRVVVGLVAKVWRYPACTLRGDPALTAGWIAARTGRRLNATAGVLYGHKPVPPR